jgi:hypothetical protein
MIIDTDEKLVIFRADEVLTLDELWALIDLLEPGLLDAPDVEVQEVRPPSEYIRYIYEVPSRNSTNVYAVVNFNDGSWACSCPDWIHRRSDSPYLNPCKHIFAKHMSRAYN